MNQTPEYYNKLSASLTAIYDGGLITNELKDYITECLETVKEAEQQIKQLQAENKKLIGVTLELESKKFDDEHAVFILELIQAADEGIPIEVCDEEDYWYVQRPAYIHLSDLVWRRKDEAIRITEVDQDG